MPVGIILAISVSALSWLGTVVVYLSQKCIYKNLRKNLAYPFHSAYTVTIVASLLFWPVVSRVLALAALFLGMGAALLFTVRRSWLAYQQGQLTRPALACNLAVDLASLLLGMAAAMSIGGWAGRAAGFAAGSAIESQWVGMGTLAVILYSLLAGAGAGFLAGILVRVMWGRLFPAKSAVPVKRMA